MDKVRNFLNKHSLIVDITMWLLIIVTFVIWQVFTPERYFIFVIALFVESFLYIMLYMEKIQVSGKEIAIMAALATISVVARIIFFALPQIKPTAAIVFISGLTLGKTPGFVIGVFSIFLSNFVFGHSFSSPFQMLGMGLVGFLAGLLAKKNLKKKIKLWKQVIYAFVLVMVVYGLTVDTGSILFNYQYQGELAIYVTLLGGLPFNLAHALSTVIFLAFLSPLLSKQITRVCKKYGLFLLSDKI